MTLKQSFCYPCFSSPTTPLAQLFASAAEMGYAATELWSWDESLDLIVSTAKQAGLIVSSITGHDSIEKGLNDAREHDRIESELKCSIDKAAEHGIPGVICFSGNRHPHTTDLEDLVVCAQGLRKIAPYAESKGVNLNLEILNSRIDHPGYQCDRVDWGIALVEMVSSSRVKLLFDIYHVQIMEGDIIRHLDHAMPHIGHIHTAGNPGRRNLDDGEMNYPGICRALIAAGYQGYVGHEFFTKGDDKIEALRQAFELCAVK